MLGEADIWDDKAWGSVLGCVGSAPERVEGSAGQGRQGRAGQAGRRLLIMELGTHARMKHLKIVEWWVDRVNAGAGGGWNED